MFRDIMAAYEPGIRLDRLFRRRMMAYTFIHRFGPDLIGGLMRQPAAPKITALTDLQSWLWPPL
jgi:hypothetical protein